MVRPTEDEQTLELIRKLKGFNYVSLNVQPPNFRVRLIDFATLQFDDKFEEQLHSLCHYWEKDKGRLKKEFDNTLHFLNELVRKSYKKEFKKEFDPIKKKFKGCEPDDSSYLIADAPNKLSVFDLLRIAECYEPPAVEFSREETLDAFAEFETDPLKIVFNDMKSSKPICTQNKEPHSLASYQDAADPFTHCLRLFKRGNDTTQQEAMIVEATAKNLNSHKLEDCLLVEGVYGTPSVEDQRDNYFDYMYKCLVHYAFKAGKPLAFNTAHSDNSQIEPKLFLNHICENHFGKRPLFILNKKNGRYELSKRDKLNNNNYRIKAFNLNGDKDVIIKTRQRLEEKLNGIFTKPSAVLDAFGNEKRYLDTTFSPRHEREYESREYYFDHQFLKRHKGQWNERDGNAKLIYLDCDEVKAEHIRLFPEYHPEIHANINKKNTKKTIAKIIAGFALFTVLASGLAYSYHKKETQFDKMKESAITQIVDKICPDCSPNKKKNVRSKVLLLNQQPAREEVEVSDIIDSSSASKLNCGRVPADSDICGETEYEENWERREESIKDVKKDLAKFCIEGGIKKGKMKLDAPYCNILTCKTYLNGIGCTEYDIQDLLKNIDLRNIQSIKLIKNHFNNFTYNHSLVLDYKDIEVYDLNPFVNLIFSDHYYYKYQLMNMVNYILSNSDKPRLLLNEISEGELSMRLISNINQENMIYENLDFDISSSGLVRATLNCKNMNDMLTSCLKENNGSYYPCGEQQGLVKYCDKYLKNPQKSLQLFKWRNINKKIILKSNPLNDLKDDSTIAKGLFDSFKYYLDMYFPH